MSVATLPPPGNLATTPPPRTAPTEPEPPFGGLAYIRRFTVAEYHRLIRDEFLTKYDPVELLEGYLVLHMSRGIRHDFAVAALNKRLARIVPDDYRFSCQTAATLADSEPEPDFTIARGPELAFADHHPRLEELALVVEVSDSSLTRDSRDKARIYARAGVPVYWVVRIPDGRVDVLTDPDPTADPPAYRTTTPYPAGTAVPIRLDGVEVGTIPVSDVIR